MAPAAALSVPVQDHAALAACLARVLDDESVRLSIARAAHDRAVQEDADFTARRFLELYARACVHAPH
jgi:hypothetical protein